jgi:amino acid transporter
LVASVLIIGYWFDKAGLHGAPGANPALYVTIFLAVIIAINYFGVGFFGEFEFWFSSAKVLIMIGLIIFTLVCAAGGAGNHDAPGFRYWNNPGAFAAYGPRTYFKPQVFPPLLTPLQKTQVADSSVSGT